MFATHYLIVMIIYNKLPTADFHQHTQVFMKATSAAGASRMMSTTNKALCLMSSNYHFHKLNVGSAEYQFSPATPITNTIPCILYVSQVKSPFSFLHGHSSAINCRRT